MKDDVKMKLDIQRFAEESDESVVSSTETEQTEKETVEKSPESTEKTYSRAEVNKMINAEKSKARADAIAEIESKYAKEKSEAEKLAKMNAEQKLNYELEQKENENSSLKKELNSLKLENEATAYANEKGLPLGYIKNINFAEETADTIKEKIDDLIDTRNKDLSGYLKDKLKQDPPKAIENDKTTEDPYIKGYKEYMSKNR